MVRIKPIVFYKTDPLFYRILLHTRLLKDQIGLLYYFAHVWLGIIFSDIVFFYRLINPVNYTQYLEQMLSRFSFLYLSKSLRNHATIFSGLTGKPVTPSL